MNTFFVILGIIFTLMVTAIFVVLTLFLVKTFEKMSIQTAAYPSVGNNQTPQAVNVYVNGLSGVHPGQAMSSVGNPMPVVKSALDVLNEEKTPAQKLLDRKARMDFSNPTIKKVESNFNKAGKEIISNA